MASKYLTDDPALSLNSNVQHRQKISVPTYEVMHMERVVATISMRGHAEILHPQFMPFDLYLEESDEFDSLLGNTDNFRHWCASRVLSLDRQYAKEIMNSIGVAQAITDKERAKIALSYHCVSLTDVFWVREAGENVSFSQLNLYDNKLNEAIVELSLRGKQMTVTNRELASDLSTKGCFPKAWIRRNDGFLLLKDGGEDTVQRELLASAICQCFDIPQVKYEEYIYDGQIVSKSKIVTSKQYSMASKLAYEVYTTNNDLDVIEECIKLDPITYYGMNILDYLTGNTDRHPENWGVLVDNSTNIPVSLYPLMDFNQSFLSYDTLDGARCQTTQKDGLSQRDAAIEAVKAIGLRQVCEMDMSLFNNRKKEAIMFQKRLDELRKYIQ